MLKAAITGNIGSGKTTVCRIFESLDIPVFYADTEAKKLYEDPTVIAAVEKAFGSQVFDEDKQLIKQKLADIVFRDPSSLKILNNIIHPKLIERYQTWLEDHALYPYTLHEAAVIFENGLERQFDAIINVSAPEDIRISRVKSRDGSSSTEIKSRMKRQWPDEKKNNLSDYVIINDGNHFLIPQVINIHKNLSKKSENES